MDFSVQYPFSTLETNCEFPSHMAQHVVMIRTDILNRRSDRHFIQIALAFQHFGHRVTIITCSKHRELCQTELRNISVIKTATWIPKHINGRCRYLMYVIRSLCVVLRYFWFPITPTASIIFSNASCVALPFLLLLNRFGSTIHLQNPAELAQICYRLPKQLTWILQHTLLCAEEILVPDAECHKIFNKYFSKYNKLSSVLYPSVDIDLKLVEADSAIENVLSEYVPNGYLFFSYGDYHPYNNFELGLAGFMIALTAAKLGVSNKMHLVIGGKFDETDPIQNAYYNRICSLVDFGQYNQYVTLLKKVTPNQKKTLMHECVAIVHSAIDAVYNSTILEAMYMGKAVVCTDCSFGSEVLVDEVTGFVLPAIPERFAEIIQKLVQNRILSLYVGNLAETEFRYRYSFQQFAAQVNIYLQNASQTYYCVKHNKFHTCKKLVTLIT